MPKNRRSNGEFMPKNRRSNGDFVINRKYTVEVGGASKTFKQIKGIENSYLAVDNTPIGDVNRIPLWLFGMMY